MNIKARDNVSDFGLGPSPIQTFYTEHLLPIFRILHHNIKRLCADVAGNTGIFMLLYSPIVISCILHAPKTYI